MCYCWSKLGLKFGPDGIYISFGDIAIFIFRLIGFKLLIHAHFGEFGTSPNDITFRPNPKRAVLARKHAVSAIKSVQQFQLGVGSRKKDRTVTKVTKWLYFVYLGKSLHCT